MESTAAGSRSLTLLIKPAAGLCNLSCGYCFYRSVSVTRENRVMDEKTRRVLCEKIGAFRPTSLSVIFQGGEPTLAGLDFFKAFTEQIKERVHCPVAYALQTNGLLLDDAYAAFFKENGFLIGLSLDGAEETNDRYRLDKNGESVLQRTLDAARLLEKHGVPFNILSVVDDKNAEDVETTWRFMKEQGFRFLQFIPFIDEGSGVSLSAERWGRFLKRSFDLWYDDFMRGDYISVRHVDNYVGILLGRQPESCAMCGFCGAYFVVEANGDLYPCDFYCKEEYMLGSVFDEAPFAPGEAQRAFILPSLEIHKACRGCRYYFLCRGGCRRDRTDGFTKNRYCAAYRAFFDASLEKMKAVCKRMDGVTFPTG